MRGSNKFGPDMAKGTWKEDPTTGQWIPPPGADRQGNYKAGGAATRKSGGGGMSLIETGSEVTM